MCCCSRRWGYSCVPLQSTHRGLGSDKTQRIRLVSSSDSTQDQIQIPRHSNATFKSVSNAKVENAMRLFWKCAVLNQGSSHQIRDQLFPCSRPTCQDNIHTCFQVAGVHVVFNMKPVETSSIPLPCGRSPLSVEMRGVLSLSGGATYPHT